MPESAARTYTVILDWLEDQLRSGEIRVGDKLPGERILAERFGISRPSVREATRILDAMGLVRTATGSGPNSGAIVISEPSAALSWALRMHVATRSLPVADIVRTRILLET
ncbi:MAG: GntR family transcriptional regulator, partial [Micrococcus sp.]|nr:GntR family transcriptional regulator [Micrococcus sp.]